MKLTDFDQHTFLLLCVLFLPAVVQADTHKATVSPSGHYRIASAPIEQRNPGGNNGSIGSVISLVDANGNVLSKCFSPFYAYNDVSPEVRGSNDWQTKGYWNTDETMVAVYSGGHTWSKIDFYSV